MEPHVAAKVTWATNEPTIIVVDPAQHGIIRCVIHELLHLALRDTLIRFDNTDLEEPIILALELKLYDTLTLRQHSWWRRAIQQKLAEVHPNG